MVRIAQILTLTLLFGSAGRAELVHELFYRLPNGADGIGLELLADRGGVLDATIVFRETVFGNADPIIGATGLGGVGFRMTADGNDGRLSVLERPTFQIPSPEDGGLVIAGASPFGDGVTSITSPSSGVFEAILGRVQLVASTVEGAESLFSFVDVNLQRDDFAGRGPDTTLRDSTIRMGTLSITAVPEPSHLLVLSLTVLGGLVFWKRGSAIRV